MRITLGVTAVMHFAEFAYVGGSVTEPDTYRNNVGGLSQCLRRCAEPRSNLGRDPISRTLGLVLS
jgi:UDP-glucose 4-epimerase